MGLHEGKSNRGSQVFLGTASSATPAHELSTISDIAADIEATMRACGADGYWMVHNHPSGVPTPSPEDEQFTRALQAAIRGFRGHVIIDSNRYGFISPKGKSIVLDKRFHGHDPSLQTPAQIRGQAAGELIDLEPDSAEALAVVYKTIERTNQGVLVATNTQLKTMAASTISLQIVLDELARGRTPRLAAFLSRFARHSGGGQVYLVLDGEQYRTLFANHAIPMLTRALEQNFLADIIVDGESVRTKLVRGPADTGVVLGRRGAKGHRVRE